MNILLTGIDGYVGWPTALRLSKTFPSARIIGVDNFARRRWVEASGCVSAIPIASMPDRLAAAAARGFTNISFIQGDLTDLDFVYQLIRMYRFDVVLHAAAQPSAPYSHIDGARAAFTQHNNVQSTLNLLWAIHESGLDATCHVIETTTMGVYGAPEFEIPEGFVTAEHKGRRDRVPFPGMAGSWYHMTKAHDAAHLYLANKLWKMRVTDLRTAIVYGAETEETCLDPRLATRFDFDFYFGVVLNRFCAMAMTGHPITIYGKGEQRKPQISLEDCVQSTVNAVALAKGAAFDVYNQATEPVAIVDLATAIQRGAVPLGLDVEVVHIPNPRVEKEEHAMTIDTARFRELLPSPKFTVASATEGILTALLPYRDVLTRHRDRFMTPA